MIQATPRDSAQRRQHGVVQQAVLADSLFDEQALGLSLHPQLVLAVTCRFRLACRTTNGRGRDTSRKRKEQQARHVADGQGDVADDSRTGSTPTT